ncbi:LysR family transcriptional regulator [Castellaniella sp.]|uniref:LysR family transcriptional regulator n=1 Tax=Castellaniella sp. TaxID=1955812 RepID=UPI0035669D30
MQEQPASFVAYFDLVDLRLFVRISEELSLTQGAEKAFMSVSAASQRIKNLEETFGTKLLVRSNRGMSLTEAGDVFLNHARNMLSQITRLQGDLQEYSLGMRGHIRLFANTSATSEWLPRVLGKFISEHETISVHLQERLSPEVARAVHEGVADVGILAGTIPIHGLESVPYRKDGLVVAVPMHHPLAAERFIRFADTLEYDFVGLGAHSAIHTLLYNETTRLGRSMRVRIQVASFDTMCRLIEENVGIGILPESAASRMMHLNRIHIINLLDEWAERELRICARKFDELPVYTHEFIDFILKTPSPTQYEPASMN